MNITKKKLAENISVNTNISIEDSKNLVSTFFLVLSEALKTRNIKISKFGAFHKKITPKRIGRNPQTMEDYLIPEKPKISFKSSTLIRKILN